MGENKNIEELDDFAKKYLKEISPEKAPIDFTASIINSIVKEKTSGVFKTSALISKKGWFLIAATFVAFLCIPFFSSKENTITFPELNFSFLEKFQNLNILQGVTISNTVLYAVFLFAFMLLIQLVFLKKYFEKRYH